MQFQEHIDCYQPGVTGLEYANYGCFCGTFNQGRPIDSVDSCCYLHDLCYGQTDRRFNMSGKALSQIYFQNFFYQSRNLAELPPLSQQIF